MIRCTGLSKSFKSTRAVKQISLQISKQEIFGLVGPDGAGKSTLFRMLCGILSPDQGEVLLMDKTPWDLPRKELGYMPQRFSLYPELSVMENIIFFGSMYNVPKATIIERADEILSLTGLLPFKKRLAEQLSGGMKQKLALTSSLITRPSILILDEPTYGVDPQSRKEFWTILYHLNQQGMTILMSTPYMDEAELCHRVGIIHEGTLLAADNPDELKQAFPYTILELKTNLKQPRFFEGVEGVIDSSFFGYKYHLFVEDAQRSFVSISAHLAAHGEEILSIDTAAPSMEDVFVGLVKLRGLENGFGG